MVSTSRLGRQSGIHIFRLGQAANGDRNPQISNIFEGGLSIVLQTFLQRQGCAFERVSSNALILLR